MTLTEILMIVGICLILLQILISSYKKSNSDTKDIREELRNASLEIQKIDSLIRTEFSNNRQESNNSSKEIRQELSNPLNPNSAQNYPFY